MFFWHGEEKSQEVSIVIIFARYQDNWIVCKHKGRLTVECPGGHVEKMEEPFQAACRELYEETGAIEFKLYFVDEFSYSSNGEEWECTQLYYAEVFALSDLPKFEMEEIYFCNNLGLNWTYPDTQVFLNRRIEEFLNIKI